MRRSTSARLTARIVIVDDDEYVREVTDITLSEAGHTVRATGSGLEALRWLEEEPCELLIIDLRMPEIDGPTLLREVRAKWPHDGPRVLLLSGCTERPSDPSTGQPIDCPVLIKPFSLDDLSAAVARLLAQASNGSTSARA